ncbi:MAG: ABC transporter ATP-binding protein [Infirmifilum sp.]
MEWAVETEGIVKIYRDRTGEVKALDNVNIRVPRGVLFGLFGPNGSGKTTLISILVGLQLPTEGTARVLGFDSLKESLEIRKRVGLLPENYGFYEYMTAFENLRFLGRLDGIPGSELDEKINKVLDLVGLKERANTKVKAFSRGMTQRLALAQALLKDPELLILDEPTLGLDPQGTATFRELVSQLVKEGKTILISTHLLHEIGFICTHAAFIRKGKIVAQGSLEELAKPYRESKGFSYEITVQGSPEDLLKEIRKLPEVIEVRLKNNTIYVRTSKDMGTEMRNLAGKIPVKSFVERSPSWDELYQFYHGGGWGE